MQEIRILFSPAAGNGHRASLTDGNGKSVGVEVPFTPFLTDDDFDNLRWYLEEYMELPDGGAVVRAERIEGDLAKRSAEMKSIVFRSVAPRLIQAGVGSVLSMGHAVHVEAAKILLDRFYRELVRGTTIGHAVAQGRSALSTARERWLEYGPGARTLRLQD
jgi:hypothetical protein